MRHVFDTSPYLIAFSNSEYSEAKEPNRYLFDLLTRFIEFENIKRITLCGHSLGGAVSHVYLLLYLILYFNGGTTFPENLDILSIAFGSPFVAGNEIRKWLRERQKFSKCFWTFVHGNDCVPRSLNIVDNYATMKQIYDSIEIFVQALG
ncbi:11408_t:CDS:2 [Dentiscutata heterogama]|uniref:11408_t:CDS:1 n=1 Tax=Dentiscutata heterogama TaxID=1316150 RepID=A0ACA9KHT7_9GLOM|nr:11408_t:CDS:2 [Dentiscutata heterogama]